MTWLLTIAGSVLAVAMVLASPLSQWLGQSTTLAVLLGGLAGLFGGLLIEQARRIRRLEQTLKKRAGHDHGDSASSQAETQRPARKATAPVAGTRAPAPAAVDARPARQTTATPPPPRNALNDGIATLTARVRGWFFDGNLPVKIGVLVSFIGVAALLRFAADQGWLSLPIELRLTAVAVAALAALAFAWRQRERRRVFALALQGGAVGVLVMSVFAAFALYSLMPATLAFALLLLLVVATAVLAVAQTSQVLAVLGLVAAFAAPILVSSDSGGPVELFGYYLVVNLGVLGLAWRQHWPLLNRLGFVFTFIVATLWGVLEYRPALYAATQPFLVLFFLFYAAIPVLHAISGRDRQRLDVLLVFALPLIVFPLQFALVDGEAIAVAASALALGAVHTLAAWYVRGRAPGHPLWPAQAALALGFATLAIPFALSGPVIALVWAVEGAALVWLGIVQQRRLTRLAGLVLQIAAGLAWLAAVADSSSDYWRAPLVLFNPPVLGALSLVLAAVFSARLFARAHASAALMNLLAAWALGWWLTGGAVEIVQQLEDSDQWVNAVIAYLGVTAWLAARAHRAYPLWVSALATTGAVALSLAMVALQVALYQYVFAGWGIPAWVLFALAARAAEHELRAAAAGLRGVLAILVHLAWIVVPALALIQLARDFWLLGSGWQWLTAAVPALAIGFWLTLRRTAPLSPSLPGRQRSVLTGVVAGIVFGGVLYSLQALGDPAPLGFVPVLNPLELTQLGALILLANCVIRLASTRARRAAWITLAGTGLMVITAIWLRLAHHGYGVAWTLEALADSNMVQAGLSVLWTLLAVALWVSGSRFRRHAVWLAGALLLGVVLIKLLLVDRQFLSTMAGIVSFLAFGGLCMAVGFLAPAPPREMNQPGDSK